MKSPSLIKLMGGLTAALILAAGCGAGAGETGGDDTVRIGFFAPTTGFGAPDGRSALAGAELAVKQINADNGIDGKKVELVQYDDGSDPKQGAVIATKLATQDHVVAAVSGSYSPQTLAAAAIFQRNKIPMISAYAVNPGIPKTGDFIFQQDFDGVVQGRAGAQVLSETFGAKKPAVIAIDNDFGAALVKGFEEEAGNLGLQIVSSDKNQFGEKNFESVIRRAMDRGADSVYLVQYVAEGKQFLQAWQQSGATLPLLSTEGIDSAGFIDSIGSLANGMMFTTNLNREGASPETKTFIADFEAAYDFAPDMVAASSHDSVMLLAGALREGGTDSAGVQQALVALDSFTGATGTVKQFTDNRQVVKPVQIQQFKDDKIVSVGQIDDPEIITP